MNNVLKKSITFLCCFCMLLTLTDMPVSVHAAENQMVQVSINSRFLSEDLFDIGYSFFHDKAKKTDDYLTIYFRQLGVLEYEEEGMNIKPIRGALASEDAGPDWDGYRLPYEKGRTTYRFKIYSKIDSSYYWELRLQITDEEDIGQDTDDSTSDTDNITDDIGNTGSVSDGIYEIPVSVIQEASSAASMLEQYTYSKASLKVADGVYQLTLYVKHWYDQSAGTQAVEYIIYQGSKATKKENAKTIDGELYDTHTFILADLSSPQLITAMVIPMEQISAGFGTQNARLVMDFSEVGGAGGSTSTSTSTVTSTLRAQLGTLIDAAGVLVEENYTEESWSELKSALTTAKSYYNNSDATDIQLQTQITALQEAIAGLIVKSTSSSSTLADGTYTIKVSAIKATSSDTSMANTYLKKTADLVVANGTYKLTVYFKAGEMNYLKYNGSKATKTSGSSYDGYTFTLANTGKYHTITVSVKEMEKINASLSVQSCRLVLDWDSVSSDGATTEEVMTEIATEEETETYADTLSAVPVITNGNTSSDVGYRKGTVADIKDAATLEEDTMPLVDKMDIMPTSIEKKNQKHLLPKASVLGIWVAGIVSGFIGISSMALGGLIIYTEYKRRYQR